MSLRTNMNLLCAALLAALMSSVLFTGCFQDDRVSGGDDFPNSVETLGKEAAGEVSDSTDWNGYDEAPSTPPEVYDSTEVPDDAPSNEPTLQKQGAGSDGRVSPGQDIAGATRTVVTLLDSATGLNRIVRVQFVLGIEARDTTWYRLQGVLPNRRVVRMSGAILYNTGRVERFSFEDADGDSVLSPVPGSRNLARARFVVTFPTGRIEERTVILAAGPDRTFGTPDDNATRSLESVHRIGTDTIYHLKLRPVAGDSVVRDRNRDSAGVDVEHTVVVGGVRISKYYRSMVRGDSLRNRATRFRRVVTTSKGVTETVALGRDSLPDFAPRDTGVVRVTFTSTNAADTVESIVATYRVAVTDSVRRPERSRLLRVNRVTTYRFGPALASRSTLNPAAPVPGGSFARSGDLVVRVDLRAGGFISFLGLSTDSGFEGTWFTSTGEAGTVRYGTLGDVMRISAP